MERTRNWLARRSRWLWPTVTAIAVAVAVMTVAAAQTGGGRDRDRDGWRGHDNECAELAALAGTDCEGLQAGFAEGQTLAEIAAANGVERQTLIDAIAAEINEEIDEAVANGKLTDAQADRYRERVADKVAAMVDESSEHRGRGGRDRHDRFNDGDCDELAALLGTDCETLKTSLKAGQTPAEIAESNDIEPQTVIDALVAEMNTELDAKVESGDLTEAKADALRARLANGITEFVNNGFGHDGDRGGRHGKKGDRGGFTAECDELAELVGTADCAGLKAALADDQTLAQIAESNDIEAQTVIDALVAEANAEIDAKVESGRLTEARAETIRERLNERISDFVNNGFERAERGTRGKGHGLRW